MEKRWIARLREGLVVNFPKLFNVGAQYNEKVSIIGTDDSAVLVLFSWDFVFHKQCEVQLATLWPQCDQIGVHHCFQVLPELSASMTETDWDHVKWWC